MTQKNGILALVVIIILAIAAGAVLMGGESENDTNSTPEDTTPPVVGILTSDASAGLLTNPLADLGYIEGENIEYVIQPAAETADYEPAVQALIAADVDVIISIGTPVTLTASKLTSTIPIVFIGNQGQFISDLEPLMSEQGASTNLTGVITTNPSKRRFDIMMEIDPTIKTVYYPYDPSNPLSVESLMLLEESAAAKGVTIIPHAYNGDSVGARESLDQVPDDADAIIIPSENPIFGLIPDLMGLAMQRKIALVASLGLYNSETYSFPGILMGYGGGITELYDEAVELVDQILQGTAPADLPVRPSEVYLTVSLGAAEVLGLEIPSSVLDQANYILRETAVIPTEEAPSPTDETTADATQAATSAEGSSAACNATLVTAMGESVVCLARGCDQVEDTGMITYEDKTPVDSCSTENVMGICSRAIGDSYFYSGDVALLQGGCVAGGGEWKTPAP